MTGDVALQVSILIVGFAVFSIAMVAGLITMREWARRSEANSPSDWKPPLGSF